MNDSLWCRRYRPEDYSSIIRQDVRKQMEIVEKSHMNTLIGGPRGVGKSSISDVLVSEIHSESKSSHITLNVSDVFNMTKKEISNDDRFSNIVDKSLSKRNMIQKAIKDLCAYETVSGGFRTFVFDNFESARKDFQNFLRRIIEKYSNSTQFIFITREPLSTVDAIRSRCYGFNVRPMRVNEFENLVDRISINEGLDFERKGVSYLWSEVKPNLRKALLILQTAQTNYNNLNINSIKKTIAESSNRESVQNIIDYAEDKDYESILSESRELIEKQDLETGHLIEMIVNESTYILDSSQCSKISQVASDVDVSLTESVNEPIEIVRLFAEYSQLESE